MREWSISSSGKETACAHLILWYLLNCRKALMSLTCPVLRVARVVHGLALCLPNYAYHSVAKIRLVRIGPFLLAAYLFFSQSIVRTFLPARLFRGILSFHSMFLFTSHRSTAMVLTFGSVNRLD